MALRVKLTLAFLIFQSVFSIACVGNVSPTPTVGNSNAPVRAASNSTVDSNTSANSNVARQIPQNVNSSTPPVSNADTPQNAPTATIRALDMKATAGRDISLQIELESKEDISVMIFSLDFDPSAFTYVSSKLNPGAPKSAVLTVNAEQTAAGKLGALIDSSTAFASGKKAVMTVVFHVAPNAPAQNYNFNFTSRPAKQSVSTVKTQLVNTKFEPATVRIVASH